jgi:4-hydroxy-tetrahydrodipicolinate synthase
MNLEKGVYTVLVTPFTENNMVDFPSIKKLIDKQLGFSTVKGLVLLGSTGENGTIKPNEKLDIINFVYHYVNGRKKIIVGINNNDTDECVKLVQTYKQYADYFMLTVPYYNKPSQNGLYSHFYELSEKSSKPIILYNIPSRTGVNLNPKTIAELYNNCENIVGIKESSGSLDQIIKIKRSCKIDVFAGDDAFIIPTLSLNGCGVFSVASQIVPELITGVVDKCLEQNYREAFELFNNYSLFIENMFIETNPVPIKYMLYMNKLIKNPDVRKPLCELTSDNKMILEAYCFTGDD